MENGPAALSHVYRDLYVPVFSDVDVFSCKQSIPESENVGLFCKPEKKLVGLVFNDVFGVIE